MALDTFKHAVHIGRILSKGFSGQLLCNTNGLAEVIPDLLILNPQGEIIPVFHYLLLDASPCFFVKIVQHSTKDWFVYA